MHYHVGCGGRVVTTLDWGTSKHPVLETRKCLICGKEASAPLKDKPYRFPGEREQPSERGVRDDAKKL